MSAARGAGRTRTARRRTVRIGLTGPIGCGKTTVGGWLGALGAHVIDADAVARAESAPGTPVHAAILERFGAGVRAADGTLDRAALGRVVFADPAALADLEALVHPAVRRSILEAVGAAEAAGAPAVVVEAIRLVEGGLAALCDEVWLVTCGEDARRARLAARGLDPEDAARRIAAQAGLEDRVRPRAARVIATDGSPEATAAEVRAAFDAALGRRTA